MSTSSKCGGTQRKPPTFYDGLACTEVLDAIRQSAAADGEVVLL